MNLLTTRLARALLIAVPLTVWLAACDAPKPASASPTPPAIGTPESSADRKADTAGDRVEQGPHPATVTAAGPRDGTYRSTSQPDPPTAAQHGPPFDSPTVDADVARFVPQDVIVRIVKRDDLDGDGHQDVLLVLQEKSQEESTPRTLMILRGYANGTLEKAVENPRAILCSSCGGTMGDPLSDVRAGQGKFSLVFEGGSRELWSRTYQFVFSKAENDWHLERVDTKMLDRIDGRDEEHHETREQIGAVSIKDFDAALMAQESDT